MTPPTDADSDEVDEDAALLATLAERHPEIADLTSPASDEPEALPVEAGIVLAVLTALVLVLSIVINVAATNAYIKSVQEAEARKEENFRTKYPHYYYHRHKRVYTPMKVETGTLAFLGTGTAFAFLLAYYLLRWADTAIRRVHRRWRVALESIRGMEDDPELQAGLAAHPDFARLFFHPRPGVWHVRWLVALPAVTWAVALVAFSYTEMSQLYRYYGYGYSYYGHDPTDRLVHLHAEMYALLLVGWVIIASWGSVLDLLGLPRRFVRRISAYTVILMGLAVLAVIAAAWFHDGQISSRDLERLLDDDGILFVSLLWILALVYGLPLWVWTLFAGGRAVSRHLQRQSLLQRAEDGGMGLERARRERDMAEHRDLVLPTAAPAAPGAPPAAELHRVAIDYPELADLMRPRRPWLMSGLAALMVMLISTCMYVFVTDSFSVSALALLFAVFYWLIVASGFAWSRTPVWGICGLAVLSVGLGITISESVWGLSVAFPSYGLFALTSACVSMRYGAVNLVNRLRWRWARRAGIGSGEAASENPLARALLANPALRPWFVLPPIGRVYTVVIPLITMPLIIGTSIAYHYLNTYGYYYWAYDFIEMSIVMIGVGGLVLTGAGIALDALRVPRRHVVHYIVMILALSTIGAMAVIGSDIAALDADNFRDLTVIIMASSVVNLGAYLIRYGLQMHADRKQRWALYDAILDDRLDPDDIPVPSHVAEIAADMVGSDEGFDSFSDPEDRAR